MESRWKSPLPPTYGASLLECGLWVQRTPGASQKNRSIFLSLPVEHFVPSCSSIGNKDKPGTTVRRENTRSHSDLDMWNRLAPYVLKLFGRHGKSSEEKKKCFWHKSKSKEAIGSWLCPCQCRASPSPPESILVGPFDIRFSAA